MFDLSILTNYSFLSIALGTVILAFTAGSIGCISVIKGESLIGDAIGHSSFPGIIFMFMLFSTREPAILLLGAFLSGTLAYFYIQIIKDYSFLKLDAILAITLSTFFWLRHGFKNIYSRQSRFPRCLTVGFTKLYLWTSSLHTQK